MAGPVTNVKNLCSTEFTMEMSVTSQVVVMTMRFFIYPTHLDSREHVVIATLLNGMKMCCPPWKKFLCHIHLDAQNADSGKMAFYPAFDCSPVLLSGLSWIDPNIYCNHTISFTFLLFNEIKMWVLCWGVSKAGGGWDWDLALVPVSVVLECV